MLFNEEFVLTNSNGDEISGNVRCTDSGNAKPLILVFHGFKGFKNWGFFPILCANFAERGALLVNFNFSLNGVRGNADIFDEPEKFARNTVAQECADAAFVLGEIQKKQLLADSPAWKMWNGEIFLLGHSRGGAAAILTADREKGISRVALWGAISRYGRFTERQKKEWRERGFLEALNTRTGQMMRLNVEYLEDIERHKDEYSLTAAIARIQQPVLIVHGSEDLTVPVKEAHELMNNANPTTTQLHIIPATGHTFGAEHPFKIVTPALREAMETTLQFFGL